LINQLINQSIKNQSIDQSSTNQVINHKSIIIIIITIIMKMKY